MIIFDALNAPVLWVDANPDQAAQGKNRAIPAKYVYSVMEVKTAFGAEPARNALQKLRELNEIASHFPPYFSSAVIFIELPLALASQGNLLCHRLPEPPIHGFWGGLLLRCEINGEMSGQILVSPGDGSPASVQLNPSMPPAKNIDTLDIFLNSEGNCVIAEGGGAIQGVWNGNSWMVSKAYAPMFCGSKLCVSLTWSANSFSRFALDLLSRLGGNDPQNNQYHFGQVFDWLEIRR